MWHHPALTMRSLVRTAVALLGLVSFPAVLWAFFHLMPLMTDLIVLRRAGSYVPAVFEVEWARMGDGHPQAVGTIDGHREVLSLKGLLPRSPRDINDLQDLVAKIERLPVLYDPHATRTRFEGVGVRVLPATADLRAQRLQSLGRGLALGYGPACGLIGLAFLVSRLDGRGVGCWLAPSLFFLGIQPVFAAFMLVVELLS